MKLRLRNPDRAWTVVKLPSRAARFDGAGDISTASVEDCLHLIKVHGCRVSGVLGSPDPIQFHLLHLDSLSDADIEQSLRFFDEDGWSLLTFANRIGIYFKEGEVE